MRHGETFIRGRDHVPLSSIDEGRFGRMFRRLGAMPDMAEPDLVALAEEMREPGPATGWNGVAQDFDNETIPAGYTYLGQFIDHDITFDPASLSQRRDDPDALHSFRSPRFDLDSVYGSGPVDEPFQYERGSRPLRMLIGANAAGDSDLPRNSEGTALIGDPRNDENVIVSQLQLLFLRLHNRISAQVAQDAAVQEQLWFEETQKRVRWLYQWIIVHDYLPRIVGQELVDSLFVREPDTGAIDIRRRFYRPKTNAYMPLEFSVAAFRFGHSMIRGIYNLSGQVTDRPIFTPAEPRGEFDDLRGFRPLPQGWTIDWSLFFPIAGSAPQPSRNIDAKLVVALFDLPGQAARPEEESLAFRNLLRGQLLDLPSGQDVARFMGHAPLTAADLQAPDPTPLWFYLLKEAELQAGSQRLGNVGGRIVAEVLLGMLELDKQSWINQAPDWNASSVVGDGDGDGVIRMSDLIAFVNAG
jgi:hypothetical protein